MENETQHQTTVSPVNPLPPTQRPKKSKIGIIIGLIIFFLVILLGLGYYYLYIYAPKTSSKSVNQSTQTGKTQPEVVSQKPESVDPLMAKFTNPASGEKWYTQPKKLGDLGYYLYPGGNSNLSTGGTTDYYEIGSHGQNKIILSVSEDVPGGVFAFYEKSPENVVTAMVNVNNPGNDKNFAKSFAGFVKIDSSTNYDSLDIDNTQFPISGGENVTGTTQYFNFNPASTTQSKSPNGADYVTIKDYGNGFKLSKTESTYANSLTVQIYYYLQTPIGTYTLKYDPLTSTDGLKYTWVDQSHPTKTGHDTLQYGAVGSNCSDTSKDVGVTWDKNATNDTFVKVATTSTGQTVYAFKGINDPVFQEYYSEYKDMNQGVSDSNGPIQIKTPQQFNDVHGIIAYKDKIGRWLIYADNEYFNAGGCGKPVIYLYPAKTQRVSVKVGAKIEKSEPKYNPETGWKVLANPNGQLTINNEKYNSLFWEGLGNGFYPNVTNGTIIKKADAAKTMRKQLKQQGLNQTEINDFMDYWQSKIPNKPYIRLTWFNTAQMNELAPLAISPKPQTLIRVFLDMKGLDKKISIPTQKLTSIPRQGFTAIEWGGLLRGGIK